VTICAYELANLFEDLAYRDVAINCLVRIPQQKHATHVRLDESVVMSNHGHVIFYFVEVAAWPCLGTLALSPRHLARSGINGKAARQAGWKALLILNVMARLSRTGG